MYVRVNPDLGKVGSSKIMPNLAAALPLLSILALAGYLAYKK